MATPADALSIYSNEPEQVPAPLDAYQLDKPEFIPNSDSIDNRAAYTASLTEDPTTTFTAVQGEMNATGSSSTEEAIVDDTVNVSQQAVKDQLLDIVKDPGVPDQEKRELIAEYNLQLFNKNPRHLSAENAYINANLTVNNESERIMDSYGNLMNDILDFQRTQWGANQAAIAQLGRQEGDVLSGFFQTALVPFVPGLEVGQLKTVAQEFLGLEPTPFWNAVKGILAQGFAKEDVSEMMVTLPPSVRGQMAQKMRDSITSQDGVVFLDDNDFDAILNVDDYLTEGHYTSFAKWAETVASYMDIVGVGVTTKRLLRLPKFSLGRSDPVISSDPEIVPAPVNLAGEATPTGTLRQQPTDVLPPVGTLSATGGVPPQRTAEELTTVGETKTLLDIERELSSRTQFVLRPGDARAARTRINKIDAALDVLRAQRAGTKTTVDPDAARKVELQARIKGSEADLAKVKADALQLDPDATKAVTDARIRELRVAGTFFDTTIKLAKKELGELGEFTSVKGTRPTGKKLNEIENSINALRTEAATLEKRLKLGKEAKQAEIDLAKIKKATTIVDPPALLGIRAKIAETARKLEEFDELRRTATEKQDIQIRKRMSSLEKRLAKFTEVESKLLKRQADQGPPVVDVSKLPKWVQAELNEAKIIPEADVIADATNASIRSSVNPASLLSIIQEFDPKLARVIHDVVRQVGQGDPSFARSVSGSTPVDTIVHDVMPSVTQVTDDAITVGRAQLDAVSLKGLTIDPEIREIAGSVSGAPFVKEEKDVAKNIAVEDFKSATGLTVVDNSVKIGTNNGGSFVVEGIYKANRDTGFRNAKDAIDTAMLALKKYGVTTDEIELLTRNGDGTFSKVRGAAEDLSDGEYSIRITHKFDLGPHSVLKDAAENGEMMTTSWSIFDRFWSFFGNSSPDKFVFKLSSVFSREFLESSLITEATTARAGSILTKLVDTFNRDVLKLSKVKQDRMMQYMREVNARGINIARDINAQVTQGFNAAERELLKQWKSIWDSNYVLENAVYTGKKVNQGFEIINSPNGDLTLLGKPIKAAEQVPEGLRYLDPIKDTRVFLNRQQLKDLYESGGSISKLDSPIRRGSSGPVEHIILSNRSGEFFGRKIRQSDMLLRYRHGFYHIIYKTPFVIRRLNTDGTHTSVGLAGSFRDAELAVRRLDDINEDGLKHTPFEEQSMSSLMGSKAWDEIQETMGRTQHRYRGENLFGKIEGENNVDDSFVLDPIRSAVQSSKSVASAFATRPWIDVMKQKYMNMYDEFVPTVEGQKQFGLVQGDVRSGKEFINAKRMYEYIRYVDFGSTQLTDDAIAATVRRMSNVVGEASLKAMDDNLTVSKRMEAVEKALRSTATIQPTAFARNLAFQVFIAHNPVVQLALNLHQITNLAVLVPKYMPKMSKDLSALTMKLLSEKTLGRKSILFNDLAKKANPDIDALWKQWNESGLRQSINQSQLMDGSISQLGDYFAIRNPRISTALNVPKRFGYNAGEYALLQSSWLAMRHRARNAARDLADPDVAASVSAQAREFSLAQSRATGFQYTRGAIGTFLQFSSTPHAAMVQMTTSNFLSRAEKGKLIALNAMMYGVPAFALGGVSDLLKDAPEPIREGIMFGFESLTLNALLEVMSGEDRVELDFGSRFSPVGAIGIATFASNIMTSDLSEMIASAPFTSLFVGSNPRIADFARDFASIVTAPTDLKGAALKRTMVSFMGLYPTLSNAFKAAYAEKRGFSVSASGRIIDPDINSPEAIYKLFAINTQTETLTFQYNKLRSAGYGKPSDIEKDVFEVLGTFARSLAREGLTQEDREFRLRMLGEAWVVFGDHSPVAYKAVKSYLRTRDPTGDMIQQILRSQGYRDVDDIREMVSVAPGISRQDKDNLFFELDSLEKRNAVPRVIGE